MAMNGCRRLPNDSYNQPNTSKAGLPEQNLIGAKNLSVEVVNHTLKNTFNF